MLKLEKVSLTKKRKSESKQILKDISLDIPKERITLLLGKSGSGKTTILRCIAQLEHQYDGHISYKNELLKRFSPKRRAQTLGFLSQSFSLFPHMNVLKNCAHPMNVLLGLDIKKARSKVFEILSLLDMEKYAFATPQELSGGQQQRVAIARALGLNPSYLLLDEPTSALDPENTLLLIKIIKQLKVQKRGIIISSQDMAFASKIIDRVFFLEHGKICEIHDVREAVPDVTEGKIHNFLYNYEMAHTTLPSKGGSPIKTQTTMEVLS